MAGDLSAVPAISAILEKMPSQAKGYVFLEVDDIEDKHDISHPEQMVIKWLVRDPNQAQPVWRWRLNNCQYRKAQSRFLLLWQEKMRALLRVVKFCAMNIESQEIRFTPFLIGSAVKTKRRTTKSAMW